MTTKAVGNNLQKLAAQWPVDPFRPHLQLKMFLESLSHHPKLTDQAVIATRSLLQDDLRHKYKLGKRIMQPASMPHHYERLTEAFVKSSQGIGRPWWKRFFNVW
ncbi:hypothetical protein BJ322DRAFT_1065679 [Thelephora terrestris]|uniref:Uncharacterized protein n=1 Tax=Thelephora terrestris TaxID=56493 RepID=A0A9P6HDW4_9AGAM|nr:hypothetical protein BJ322DRAFT_1065679 [Thelephora terrestris]